MEIADGITIDVHAVAVDVIRHHGEDAPLVVAQLAYRALELLMGDYVLQNSTQIVGITQADGNMAESDAKVMRLTARTAA